jgi:hypothetical protein
MSLNERQEIWRKYGMSFGTIDSQPPGSASILNYDMVTETKSVISP